MSDFVSGFWSIYITVLSLAGILGCALLLWSQSAAKHAQGQTTGHVWDEDLREFNNPLPNWWRWLFYLTIAFALVYLALYPGLGSFAGWSRMSDHGPWTSTGQYTDEMNAAELQYAPLYRKFQSQDIRAVAADPEAREMGQRLFLPYCIQCHGSDARGGKGFPNLTDDDWLFGGAPEQIKESILKGRDAMMPAKGLKPDLNTDQIRHLAHYVRSLSGLTSDSIDAARGKDVYGAACGACHGPEGKGTVGLAPNIADTIWLYGSSATDIIETITKGRANHMPAFGDFLGEAKVHLLTAYVYGLSSPAPSLPAPAPAPAPTVPVAGK